MKLKDGLIAHNMGDEILIISADEAVNQGCIRGNASAALVIRMLESDMTEEEIVDKLLLEFDAPREVIACDVRMVIEKLASAGLLDGESLEGAGATASDIEEQLALHGRLMYHIKGDSMLPLLREGSDAAVIRAKSRDERCKKWDVVLYRRPSGQYVLHRVLRARGNRYYICGDNRYHGESGVKDEQVIGILEGVMRDGVYASADDPKYLEYVKKRSRFLGIKWLICEAKRKLGGKR